MMPIGMNMIGISQYCGKNKYGPNEDSPDTESFELIHFTDISTNKLT